MQIINPENGYKLIESTDTMTSEDALYEEARQQLSLTTKYHNWHDTAADKLYESLETFIQLDGVDNGIEDLIKEYNKQVGNFNLYGDACTISLGDDYYEPMATIIENDNSIR